MIPESGATKRAYVGGVQGVLRNDVMPEIGHGESHFWPSQTLYARPSC